MRDRISLTNVFWRAFDTAQRREADGDVGYVQYFLNTQRQAGGVLLETLVLEAEIRLAQGKLDTVLSCAPFADRPQTPRRDAALDRWSKA